MASGDARPRRETRGPQVQGHEDPPAELAGERASRGGFDDQPEDEVVRIGVRPARPGSEGPRMRRGDRHDLARSPHSQRIVEGLRDEVAVAAEGEQSAGVVEELAYRDALAV